MAVRVVLVLAAVLVSFYGCGQSNPVPEQAKKKDFEQLPVKEKTEATPKPETTVWETPEYFRDNCRIQTYIAEQDMSEAEVEAFSRDMRAFLAEDIEAGDYPTVKGYLEKVGVPAYDGRCAHE